MEFQTSIKGTYAAMLQSVLQLFFVFIASSFANTYASRLAVKSKDPLFQHLDTIVFWGTVGIIVYISFELVSIFLFGTSHKLVVSKKGSTFSCTKSYRNWFYENNLSKQMDKLCEISFEKTFWDSIFGTATLRVHGERIVNQLSTEQVVVEIHGIENAEALKEQLETMFLT